MNIEFDPTKDTANREKHGVSLAFGERVVADVDAVMVGSQRERDGEFRRKAIGLVDGKLWTAVFVERGVAVRFISVRRSNDGEERRYHST